WSLLWVVLAVGVVLVQSTVWTSAVAARFDKSRGMAFAVTLSGGPITAALAPLLATWLIADYGWRTAFFGVGAAWLAVTLPVSLLFFRDGRSRSKQQAQAVEPLPEHDGLTFREGLKTRGFNRLLIGFGAFSFYNMAMAANLVPLLGEAGASPLQAARIASIMGIVGIVARLSVGFLLDRFSGSAIGAVTQFLPVIGCAILLMHEPSMLLLGIAVATFGLATGAEMDTALYLATRHFGLKAFAALFSAVITFGAVNAAISPYVSGWMHDLWGSYDPLLIAVMILMSIGALAMATIGHPPQRFAGGH
ncbi:MAG TPA: MFS transporter, partial [Novosphingobium sp.]